MRTINFLLILCIYLGVFTVRGQQQTPFLGQGIPPEGGTDVYVTIALDRLVDVDDEQYRFEAIFMLLLTWSDPRARIAMLESTAEVATGRKSSCIFPCTNLFNLDPTVPCCDGVWFPHLELLNVRGYSQDRAVRYGVEFGNDNGSSVAWWSQCQGEFYTNLYFKSFPFDKQDLVVQVAYATRYPERQVYFIPGSVALTTYMPKYGDDISGWKVNNVSMITFNISQDNIFAKTTVSNPSDPYPIHPNANSTYPTFTNTLWREGFTIIISIQRISLYFVFTAIIPIALNVWLALLVFSVAPKHLDTRLGIVVTLFLSLTALMMVVADGLPQSSTIVPTQQLCLTSYFVLGVVGLESIFSYKIVTMVKQHNIMHRTKHAQKKFLKRWKTIVRSREASRTAQGQNNITARVSWLRKRKSSKPPLPTIPSNSENANGVANDLSLSVEDGQREINNNASTRGAPGAAGGASSQGQGAAQNNKPRGRPTNDDGLMQRDSTYDFVGFGGFQHDLNEEYIESERGSSDCSSSIHQAPVAIPSRETLTTPPPTERWIGRQTNKWKEAWREMKHSSDYCLYVALMVDRIMFWFVLISYNLALIFILLINAQYSPNLAGDPK